MERYKLSCILVALLTLNSCIFQSNLGPVLSKMQSKYELREISVSGKVEDVSNSNIKKYIELKNFTLKTLPSTYVDSVFFFENELKVSAHKIIRIVEEKNKNKYAWAILELSNRKYMKVEKGQYEDFETSDMLDKFDDQMGEKRYHYKLVK